MKSFIDHVILLPGCRRLTLIIGSPFGYLPQYQRRTFAVAWSGCYLGRDVAGCNGDCAVVEVRPQRLQASPLYLERAKQSDDAGFSRL